MIQIKDILATVGELGFVDIRKNGEIHITPPTFNLHKQRLELFGRIVFEYKKRNPAARFKGFFTLYDAWREHAEPAERPVFFKPGKSCLQLFVGRGTLGEPGRFIQPYYLKDRFPVFDYPVVSFGRHKNDSFVQLIPDTDFIASNGYLGLRKEIDSNDCPWPQKVPKLYWRGSMHGFPYKEYDSRQLYSQRGLLLEWNKNHLDSCDTVAARDISRGEQLPYKYLLDVDGEVNAWSGLFWKLYSKSVVFKVHSHYEQWYYPRLKPWEHYIPVAGDLSDLEEKFHWALANDAACCEIAQSGREFASSLTFENELAQLTLIDKSRGLFQCHSVTEKSFCQTPQFPDLTVVHTYQPLCKTVSQPPGFGDFLRGTITLYQLSRKYGFTLCLDLNAHPLHQYVKEYDTVQESGLSPVNEFFNQRNCELESFLVGQSHAGELRVTTHAVPNQPISRQCRQFLLKRLKPTRQLSRHVAAIVEKLGLTSYCTVHLRMGDDQFDRETVLPNMVERWFVDEILPVWGTNVLVVSDNLSIKRLLKSMFACKVMDIKPVHLGQSVLNESSCEEVRDTFAEFLIMGQSSWIYQYSVYPWGSSFSEICAQIYDIPFTRMSTALSER